MNFLDYINFKDRHATATIYDINDIAGKILIASPNMQSGGVFEKSLVLIIHHDARGSVGVIINRTVSSVKIATVFKSLSIEYSDLIGNKPLYFGGPVEAQNGLILHSGDYKESVLVKIHDNLMISSNTNIIKSIATGLGPTESIFLIGYSVWESGQLQEEIKNEQWILTDLDRSLIFSKDNYAKYKEALKKAGIEAGTFVPGGHA